MKKSIKTLLTSLLIMGTVVNVGCSQKAKEEVKKEVETKVEQTFAGKMNTNADTEEIRESISGICEVVNNGELPFAMTFRIDEDKQEIRVAIISKNKTYKITNKEYIDEYHFEVFDLLTRVHGYDGKIFTDIGVYDKTEDEYTIFYTYNYDKNGKGVLNPVKKVMTESELFDYYNH